MGLKKHFPVNVCLCVNEFVKTSDIPFCCFELILQIGEVKLDPNQSWTALQHLALS